MSIWERVKDVAETVGKETLNVVEKAGDLMEHPDDLFTDNKERRQRVEELVADNQHLLNDIASQYSAVNNQLKNAASNLGKLREQLPNPMLEPVPLPIDGVVYLISC